MAYSAQDAAYLQSKLTELQGKGKTEYQNIDQVYGAFQMAGLTPQQHAEKYGVNEGLAYPTGNVAPSAITTGSGSYSPVEKAYYEQKLEQLQSTGKTQYQNIDQVAGAFQYSGLAPKDHFYNYGVKEGLTWPEEKPLLPIQYTSSSTPPMSNTDFTVNELKTAAIADSNNPIVRQAIARANQTMNGRGLLNSSMATQAAQEAAISKALEIAAPDTAAYYTDQRDAKQFDYNSQLAKLQGDINYQNSAGLARLNNDLNIANAKAQYDMKVGDVTQTNYITMIDRIQQDTTKQVQQINSSAMPYEEKQAAIRNIQSQAQAQIDNANRLFKSTNGWQDQWAVAADTYSWQVEGAPEKPEDDNPFNNSGEY